jgi:hypothetical protein
MGQKRVRFLDVKMDKFNSELEDVEDSLQQNT